MKPRCSQTGRFINGSADGVYDEGEWISWDWINQQLEGQEERNFQVLHGYPRLLDDLLAVARYYYDSTGRYLPIFGELGELYAETKYGMIRHQPNTQGSDGRIGNDWAEVKTISPLKKKNFVRVKRSGNFNKLIVVKIDEEFNIESRTIGRDKIPKGSGKMATVSWNSMEKEIDPNK